MSIFPGMNTHKYYLVYRQDKERGKKATIGILEERRKVDREGNERGMLMLARERFAKSVTDFPNISIHRISS